MVFVDAKYNFLNENLPLPETTLQKLGRQAFMGFCASLISDTISNSLRVVKTYRQVRPFASLTLPNTDMLKIHYMRYRSTRRGYHTVRASSQPHKTKVY